MKAQGAMEFVMIFVLLIAALSIAALASMEKTAEINRVMLEIESEKLLDGVAGKINTAFLEGPGFKTKVVFPERISGLSYSITINSNQIILSFDNFEYFKNVLTQNITGNFVKGVNLIENRDGAITIT